MVHQAFKGIGLLGDGFLSHGPAHHLGRLGRPGVVARGPGPLAAGTEGSGFGAWEGYEGYSERLDLTAGQRRSHQTCSRKLMKCHKS